MSGSQQEGVKNIQTGGGKETSAAVVGEYQQEVAAKIINAALRSRAFAVECPKTGIPSYLSVNSDGSPGARRFQFAHFEYGKVIHTTSCSVLPELNVVLEDITPIMQAEQAGTWTEKTRRDAGSHERG